MRSRLIYLLASIVMLFTFAQCQDSLTQTTETNPNPPTNPSSTLEQPELLTPEANSEQSTSLTFEWAKSEGEESFQIQLSMNENFNSTLVDSIVDTTAFNIKNLPHDTTFHWQVRPLRESEEGPWSDAWSFSTVSEPAEPDPVSTDLEAPDDGYTNSPTNVELKWQTVASASAYNLQLADDKNFENLIVEKKVDGTSHQTTDLDYTEDYYWRVEPVVPDKETVWSDVYNFVTREKAESVPNATLISPEDGATGLTTSVNLEWEDISNINSYKLQVSTSNSFSSPVVDETVDKTTYEVSNLDNDQTYYWRVQAEGDDVENWSSVRSITTKKESIDDGGGDDNTTGSVEGDRQALMDLYEATGGNSWHNNSGWGSGDPSSSWHGIETDANGRVTRVDLYDNGLSGSLPVSIGNLTKVKYLNVKKNNLSGEIPSAIGNMASLERLILAGRTYEIGGNVKEPPPSSEKDTKHYHQGKRYSNTNDFAGTIPSTVGNLSNLMDLEIANQPNIKGPIPSEIGNLSKLEGLYLSFNDFSGTTLPSSLGNLTNLKHMYIASAQLEGDIPSSLENLTQLSFLNLGESSSHTPDNHLTGEIPDFSNFTELRSLIISDNNLTGEYPSYFNNGNFTELFTLRFPWNNLTGSLHGFDNLPNLNSFSVSGNQLSGTIKSQLSEVDKGVIILSLGWNNFTGEIPQNWPDFSRIRSIRLNDNNLEGNVSCDFWESIDTSAMKLAHLQNNEFDSNCTSSMNDVAGSDI